MPKSRKARPHRYPERRVHPRDKKRKPKLVNVKDALEPDAGVLLDSYRWGPLSIYIGVTGNYHGYFFEIHLPTRAFMRRVDFNNKEQAFHAAMIEKRKAYPIRKRPGQALPTLVHLYAATKETP